jgi:hypothetical protein
VTRSVPQIVSVGAALLGIALFFVTLYYIDLDETVASASRLGLALRPTPSASSPCAASRANR